jgi:hypothetical protein
LASRTALATVASTSVASLAKLTSLPHRLQALADTRDRRLALAAVVDHPAVDEWFAALRLSLIDDLLTAKSTEDDKRRATAFCVNTLDRLREFLKSAGADGQRAAEAYAKLLEMTDG